MDKNLKNTFLIDGNNWFNVLYFRADGDLEKGKKLLNAGIKNYLEYGEVKICLDTIFHDNFRKKIRGNYKKRKKKSEDRKLFLREMLKCLANDELEEKDYEVCMAKTYEADDIICTFVENKKEGERLYIVSQDKDFYSLLRWDVFLVPQFRTDNFLVITEKKVKELYGTSGKGFECYKALMGDNSDNITPLHNMTDKRALKIVKGRTPAQIREYVKKHFFHLSYDKYLRNLELITKVTIPLEDLMNKEILRDCLQN